MSAQITPKNVNALCKTIPRNTLSRLASNQSENSKQWQQVTKQLNTNCSKAERLSKTPNLNNALLRNIPEDFQYISDIKERLIGELEQNATVAVNAANVANAAAANAVNSLAAANNELAVGGRRRKSRKSKKSRKTRKTRKTRRSRK
jgi:hypothetical protein